MRVIKVKLAADSHRERNEALRPVHTRAEQMESPDAAVVMESSSSRNRDRNNKQNGVVDSRRLGAIRDVVIAKAAT